MRREEVRHLEKYMKVHIKTPSLALVKNTEQSFPIPRDFISN